MDGKEIKYRLVGEHKMHCGGCESTVEFALSQLEGVRSVKADRKEQTITLEVAQADIDLQKIQTELRWLGYSADPV